MFWMLWIIGISVVVIIICETIAQATQRMGSGDSPLHSNKISALHSLGSSSFADNELTSRSRYKNSIDGDDWIATDTSHISSFDDDSSSSITSTSSVFDDHHPSINPANGLPMVGAIDIEGNPYGTDLHSSFDSFDSFSSTPHFDDSFSSSSSHDSFSSSNSWND